MNFKIQMGSLYLLKISNVSDNQLVGNYSKPFENGEYVVTWNVIGADGHEMVGEFSFSVEDAYYRITC